MRALPFDKPGCFYKGNLHCHSDRSDGRFPPDQLLAAYRARGYDFVALTDHFWRHGGEGVTDTGPLRVEGFTTLLGAEMHPPATEAGEEWHLVAVGLPADFAATAPDETAPALAARAAEAGAFVGLAHPATSGLTLDDALSIEAAHAVEVLNGYSAVYRDSAESWHIADMLAARGRRLTAFAADDAHFRDLPDAFGAWVEVRAASLDPDALLAALKAGHFYPTEGPELRDVAVDGDRLRVACSPASMVDAGGRGSLHQAVYGDGVTEASLPLEPFRASGWCRVTVVDGEGRRAWTNPIWLD